jgi:hypothetical protein
MTVKLISSAEETNRSLTSTLVSCFRGLAMALPASRQVPELDGGAGADLD